MHIEHIVHDGNAVSERCRVNTKGKDNYNSYHSQLRIQIECAFGMLMQHFDLLCMPIPRNDHQELIILVGCITSALGKLLRMKQTPFQMNWMSTDSIHELCRWTS